MIFKWWYIFNTNEFTALDLVSRNYLLDLDGLGLVNVLVTQGVGLGITYDGTFLPLELNGKNPFSIDGRAVFVRENGDVFLGIET